MYAAENLQNIWYIGEEHTNIKESKKIPGMTWYLFLGENIEFIVDNVELSSYNVDGYI